MNPSLAVEESADRLELKCAAESAGYLAWADVIGELRLSVSEDEAVSIYGSAEGNGTEIEIFETILDKWVEVLSHRARACGPAGAYPFDINRHGLELREGPSPAYLFQLMVSLGRSHAHHDGTTVYTLFEELSAAAAARYLGDSKTAVVFGWPRRKLPKSFRDAVVALADLLREGKGCEERAGLNRLKDDKLDVVAWREFPDRKPSKLILFGQCAVGRHWKNKIGELRPRKWCKVNFAGKIAVDPIPAFFVPRALSDQDAYDAGQDQILLDRCRISALCSEGLDEQLYERLREWIDESLQQGSALDAD